MKRFIGVFCCIVMFLCWHHNSYAISDPLTTPNNFFGIHILFPDEISDAAKLVNSNGGDWGYVTIPIQANDRDLDKWQNFLDQAGKYHVIPILRLATKLDEIKKSAWKKPDDYDLVDFANFLNSLYWPTKNRYIILFNEINRFDEWGGEYPDPIYYSEIVKTAHDIFKARSDNFFLIMGGFDNASITDYKNYMNEFDFLQQMYDYDANIFNYIDGISSHSYPNPGFRQIPNNYKRMGVSTYKYEYEFINKYTTEKKYIFITETGWDTEKVGEEQVKEYFSESFTDIWGKDADKIVAVTPFLLKAEGGPFTIFSFYKNGKPTTYYQNILTIKKTKGMPLIAIRETTLEQNPSPQKTRFAKIHEQTHSPQFPDVIKLYFKMLLGLT